jgi:hypothetical protein
MTMVFVGVWAVMVSNWSRTPIRAVPNAERRTSPPVPRHYCVRIRFVDVRASAPSFYTRWATRSGCSARSDQPSPPVEISCLSISHCITSSAYSPVPIDASARPTVCSGSACDDGGLSGGTRWCSSSRPPSIAGGAKGFDSGPVALDQEGLASPQKFVPSFGTWRPTTGSGARRGSTGSC